MTVRSAWQLAARNRVLFVLPLIVAPVGAWLSSLPLLSPAGPFAFFGELNAGGSGAFVLFAQSLIALCWRILGILIAVGAIVPIAMRLCAPTMPSERGHGALRRTTWTMLLLLLVGIVAVVLLVPTFGLSIVVYLAFFLYALPAAIAGPASGPDAIVVSMDLAARRLRASLGVALTLIVFGIAGGVAGSLAVPQRFGANLVAWVVLEAAVPYAAVMVTAGYLEGNAARQAPPA